MNEITREYRQEQFNKIKEVYIEFKTKVKFVKPNGETHWIDITNGEFEAIKNILTGRAD